AVTAGGGHTCAHLASNDLLCWGRNTNGQLGDGDETSSAVPVAAPFRGKVVGPPMAVVSAGDAHTCALDVAGEVWCWGSGADNRLGTGHTDDVTLPSTPTGFTGAVDVAAGGAHTCIASADHLAFCWGANDDGQLGIDEDTFPNGSTPVPGLTNVTRVAAGAAHTCAIRDDGSVWCWGSNTSGQLGDGDALAHATPQLSRLVCR
ncbi:MAG TPA: RCC1 repeat-containing protein, partial [Polyangia bacterium]|nr:RCC1 repeat-containing protein [Polyangia bacterium]